MLDHRLVAELDRRREAEIRASLLQGRQPQDRYLTVDARRPGDEPRAASFDAMLRNCYGGGCNALVCCPPESDLPALIGGKCIVDRKITDGIHRTYLIIPGRTIGLAGRPPRPVNDVAWARAEVAATRAVGSRLRDLRGAIATWSELTPGLRRSDPFGDGERVGERARALLAKLDRYTQVCGRRDRDRGRTMAALDELLREAKAADWPAGLLRSHVDMLDIFIERAFSAPSRAAVAAQPSMIELAWEVMDQYPSPIPDPDRQFHYEEVRLLDGRTAYLDIAKARGWEGRQDFDGWGEFHHRRDLYLLPGGTWFLRSWCRPASADLSASEWWAEVGLNQAASWFVGEWDRLGDPLPDVIRAHLDSGVPLGRSDIDDVEAQVESSAPLDRTADDGRTTPGTRIHPTKPGRKVGKLAKSSRPAAKISLKWKVIAEYERRHDSNMDTGDQAIADELGCERSTVWRHLRKIRPVTEGRKLPRGSKGRDGTLEASSDG